MDDLTTIGLVVLAAAVLAAFVLAIRRPAPVLPDHDEPGPLDHLLIPSHDAALREDA